jgi:hypothetical protein
MQTVPGKMQRNGCCTLATSKQQLVWPGTQICCPQGIGASDDMSTWASLGDSMNLHPWLGAPPQHPDICATIAAAPTTAPDTSRLPKGARKSANSRRAARR